MATNADIAATLPATRSRLNLTQEQLAERRGVSFAIVNRWEGGTNMPQKAAREVIAALAREAGVGEAGTEEAPEAPAASVTRRRRGRPGSAAPTTKPGEQMIWDAACSVRGEKDAANF